MHSSNVSTAPRSGAARARLKISGAGVLLFLFAASATGCGGKPFNVKPRPDVPQATYNASGQSDGVTIQASTITDEDLLYETFDANLIMAGLLPVQVKVSNGGAESLELKKARFEVRDAGGRAFKKLDARRAYKQVISYYGISTYSKDGYKESQKDFLSHSIDTDAPLAGGESRQGILFFAVPSDVARESRLTLRATGVKAKAAKTEAAIELNLN